MIYLINSPVITSFGTYTYAQTSVDEIREILANRPYISAIGHEEVALLLSRILKIELRVNRITIFQKPGDIFIVIKTKIRLELNKKYSDRDIEGIGFELGLLTRLK